jgi:hypothetical protein
MSDMERVFAVLERLETGQNGLSDRVDRMRVDLMGRMDRLQGSMDAVRDDVTVNFENTGRVDRRAKSTQGHVDALSDMVATMFRKVHAIETRLQALEDPKP